ncbi:MAG: hypothetical protein AB8B59_16090 [Maribacter sp.]
MKNTKFFLFVVVLSFVFGCSTDAELGIELNPDSEEIDTEDTQDDSSDNNIDDSDDTENEDSTPSGDPLTTNLRTFVFGHSLIVHDPPAIATPSNETTVPHWMAELSGAASFEYAVSGQYGFLPQHANLPPIAQWGFDRAEGAWESDTEPFADADFNSILLTAGNFVQYQPATIPYDSDNPNNTTPLSATLEIFDWVEQQEPGTSMYIYENWPDMAGFLSNGVPASSNEFENYNNYTLGEFHDWWIAYHESVIQERPSLDVKMIPVGPIISRLLTETDLANIQFSELYEDDAPHGRPTIYFLASLITYMAMYGVEAPADFQVPDTVNELVRTNYETTVDFIWNELNEFNDSEGNSLVF